MLMLEVFQFIMSNEAQYWTLLHMICNYPLIMRYCDLLCLNN